MGIIYFQIYYKKSTEKKIKKNQTNKNKKSMQSKIKQLTIYKSLKLICTCNNGQYIY